MAKSTINTKSSSYQRDKEAFLKELKQFNDSKGIPYKVPKVNAIEIDLYHFYTLVQQKGGVHKVNQSDTWDSFPFAEVAALASMDPHYSRGYILCTWKSKLTLKWNINY
ncbi:ARID/BRIGHT DNA binding domain-containing protein [Phthorimaea operculella]|nr:ARID/BRIGHT DNA binding domain-containing protein [Phthorimaea operculella]